MKRIILGILITINLYSFENYDFLEGKYLREVDEEVEVLENFQKILGKNYNYYLEAIEVQGNFERKNGTLVMYGNQAHNGGNTKSITIIDGDKIVIGVVKDREYKVNSNYELLEKPQELVKFEEEMLKSPITYYGIEKIFSGTLVYWEKGLYYEEKNGEKILLKYDSRKEMVEEYKDTIKSGIYAEFEGIRRKGYIEVTKIIKTSDYVQ